MKQETAKNISELDDIHRKNREVGNLKTKPDETKLSDEEWIDYKISNWSNAMNCSEGDKGNIVRWIVDMLRLLNKEVENLKK
ncbi:MAG: hypothetical protein ACTSXD_05085 [Candidatus Heimdallarchaeaceae archaeon]